MTGSEPGFLRVSGVSKSFGRVRALDDVTFDVRAGEVHAVLGENGAGKSTLMSVVSGAIPADHGEVSVGGVALQSGSQAEARAAGIEVVHQHFMLVPNYSVEENLALCAMHDRKGSLDIAALTAPALALAASLGWPLDPKARVRDLPVGVLQRVEILKALAGHGRVLILDEPTAVLTEVEVADLFRVLRGLRDAGQSIILIAHKLDEVFQIADRVTVLRAGKVVARELTSETSPAAIAEAMVGGEVTAGQLVPASGGPVALKVTGIRVRGDRGNVAVDGADFELTQGEVFALGGVDGNGQVEIAEAVVGLRPLLEGGIDRLPGRIAYIPQDRQEDGLVLDMDLSDNLFLGQPVRSWRRFGLVSHRRVDAWAARLLNRFDVRSTGVRASARSLSGGNQQRVVVARNLAVRPDVLVAVNPTRGLDVQASAFVLRAIRAAAADGTAVLLVSTDRDEIAAIAHRVAYLDRGRVVPHMLGGAA